MSHLNKRIGSWSGLHRGLTTALRRAHMDKRIGSWSGLHRGLNTVSRKRHMGYDDWWLEGVTLLSKKN